MVRLLLIIALSLTFFHSRAGKIDTLSIYSAAMKKDMKAIVIKPSSQPPSQGYPVLYLLHGMGGAYNLWITKVPELQQAADRYGCMIICPDGGRMTLYFDNPIDSSYRFESHFIKELIPYIDANFPTAKDRRFRAIAGLSMGGFGSFFMASKYPELFAAAGSMSGALNVDNISKTVLARNNASMADSSCCSINWNNLQKHNSGDSISGQKLALAMECGLDDYLLPVNRSVHRKLMELRVAHDYTERPGRHDWNYWQNAIDYQLLFFRKRWDMELSIPD
ncbi:alpha/beta hydrolase [Flavihumibacter stibioxidans]|uniref:Esterase n=1 Tax=Flavihumibacter stibioxidans TaxID=1834163 RepID=A0ABR7MBF3_9BACT|nr:alpha/beta hydrolase-fold protein [Flavihumibacter stibioxidans]MBC6492363.1 hypothetical protein [Flavihumibacter stibioxidans]